jgi:hypothetical protein
MLAKNSGKLGAIDPVRLRSIIHLRRPKRALRRESSLSVEEITGLSPDTIARRYPDKIKYLSPRRRGMALGDAIAIAEGFPEGK